MALINIWADFEKLVMALERIDLHLQHGIRILEAAFPLPAASIHWQKPAEDLHIVGDKELLEREDEEARHAQQPVVSELGDESVSAEYDPYDLEQRHR